ncbi:MAG: DUF4384 domain-containing protein [Cytophagales bacterium]|nr:MAG: DUF4384 domain-containing protein [Cytophagales bacterium]
MKPAIYLTCTLFFALPNLLLAQAFLPGDSLKFMAECRNALDIYQRNLNNLIESESGGEMLAYQKTLLDQCFFKPSVIVYNDLVDERFPADEYATQFYNRRSRVNLNLGGETYRLNRLPDGRLELVAFVEQQVEYGKPDRKKIKNLLGVYYTFQVFAGQNGYEPRDYRIVKIEKLTGPPSQSRAFPKGLDIDSIRTRERDLSWVARRLALHIRQKLPASTKAVYLQKFSYKNSKLTNEFSDELLSLLRHRLNTDEGISTDSPANGQGVGIRGSYVQKADLLEVTAELFDLATDKIIVPIKPNTDLSMNWVREKGLILKPEGTDQALATQEIITTGAAPTGPPKTDKLSVRLSTSLKGKNREFWEKDTMYVQVRVNKPGHVRLLYVQADGSSTLLWPDFEVKPGQENKDIFFPEPFVCVPPFGQETLVAVASNAAFCPVKTKQNLYGVDVVEGSLTDAMKSVRCTETRGMGRIVEQAEDRVTLTTRAVKAL